MLFMQEADSRTQTRTPVMAERP